MALATGEYVAALYRMTRTGPSELLPFGSLAREQEGLRVFSFATDFERAEVLVPEPVGGIWIGFSPRF